MRKEAIKIKCPDRIQFGDPMYFEDYRNDPEKLQKLVVDYRPQPGFKAGVSLVETEHPEYPGFIARTMTIYFAPEQYLSIYMDGKMYASQKIDRKEIGVDTASVYTVVAVLKADVSMFPFQQVSFQEPDGLFSYIAQAKALELFDNGKNPAADDVKQVLTLVTCSYEWNGARNIVVAVREPGS